jgi:Xaa-Pro dipeptidase
MGAAPPLSERDSRFERLRERMREAELDALLVGCKGHWWTGRGYARYLTDFHLWGHDGLILFPAEGEPAMSVTSPAVAGLISGRGWVTDARGDMLILPALLSALRERKLERARIGTVGTPWIISADLRSAFAEAVPQARIEPADAIFDEVRMVKSPLEIKQNREVWELAKSAMERFAEIAQPGVSERELAAEACRVALAGGARDLLVLMSEDAHVSRPPTADAVRCDDILRYHMEISGESGHWCELTITLAFRPVQDDERSLMASELRALEAVRAAARPGARLADLAARFEDTLREDGYELAEPTRHFDFHGQGMDVIELPWYSAEQPWGSSKDAILEAGTVISYHPRRNVRPQVAWSPGVSDNLLVVESGAAERLSGAWSHEWREVRT